MGKDDTGKTPEDNGDEEKSEQEGKSEQEEKAEGAEEKTEGEDTVVNLEEERGKIRKSKEPKEHLSKTDILYGRPLEQIRSLKCFQEVDEYVRAGAFAIDIANFIQKERGEMKSVALPKILKIIRRYKSYLEAEEERIADGERKIREEMEEDPLYELSVMRSKFNSQSDRIDMEIQTEEGLNKLFSTTHKEFLALERMGKTIIGLKERFGMIEPGMHRGQAGETVQEAGRLNLRESISDPKSRNKVISVVETLLGSSNLQQAIIDGGKALKKQKLAEQKRAKAKAKKAQKAKKISKGKKRKSKNKKARSA